MTETRVYCEHPDPTKQGVRIDAWKYHLVRKAILAKISQSEEGIPFKDLGPALRDSLSNDEAQKLGSINWYVTTVKLDLEAKGLIERVPGAGPQRLRVAKTGL